MKIKILILTAITAMTVQAQESPTTKKIRDTGSMTLGHRESSIPFSYYNDKHQVIGYSQDLMLKVVDSVRSELKLSKLVVRLMPVTSANRITLVQNGTVDIECGSTTNNAERQKQVAFSTSIFVVGTKLMTKKNSGVNDFADLAGQNVVTTAGTTSEQLLRKLNEEKHLKLNVISAKDHGESFVTLENGRAVAFMMDDALLFGEMAKAKRPQDWVIVGTAQSKEAYACMIRKNDPGFKKLVDTALTQTMTSGQAKLIYEKWFQNPILPKELNLNMPMSEDMKALFKSPNDKAFE
jgi:glutamate/aspartate transport system substrate-binding protein